MKDPQDYEARSNIMWTATWALNTLIKCGKRQDWMIEIGLPLTISELGATEAMIDDIVSTTNIFPTGYMDLTEEDIREILKENL